MINQKEYPKSRINNKRPKDLNGQLSIRDSHSNSLKKNVEGNSKLVIPTVRYYVYNGRSINYL